MSDPLDSPPTDHGSDRYDYVELAGPPDIAPHGLWFERLLMQVCPDCRANAFLRFLPDGDGVEQHPHWHLEVAHDDACPWLAKYEAENG